MATRLSKSQGIRLALIGAVIVVIGLVAFQAARNPSRSAILMVGLVGVAGVLTAVRFKCCKKESASEKLLGFIVIAIIVALLVNLSTNQLQEWVNAERPSAEALYRNHDLGRLTGTVIAAVLEQSAEETAGASDRSSLQEIAEKAPANWQTLMARLPVPERSDLDEARLVDFIREPRKPALTQQAWENFLGQCEREQSVVLSTAARMEAATRLRDDFGTILRETLKHDHASGGPASKAVEAMHLNILGELLDDNPPRLTLYHQRSATDRREVTQEYLGVPISQAMLLKVENVEGREWCILTIDGSGKVDLVAPEQLQRDASGLWMWELTAAPTETVILLACDRVFGELEQRTLKEKIEALKAAPRLAEGHQIVWESHGESEAWKVVEAGRGRPAQAPTQADASWMTNLCALLSDVEGLELDGRTIRVWTEEQ